MKQILIIPFIFSLFLISCGNEEVDVTVPVDINVNDSLLLCDCLADTLIVRCDSLFPMPITTEDKIARIAAGKECGFELTFQFDTVAPLDSLPEPESIDDVLEMEVPDPISEDCQKYLEDLSAAIESYGRAVSNVSKNPDDFNAIIKKSDKEENMNEMLNKPAKFECSDNDSFRYKMEKLDEQMSKLLE